MPEQAMVSFRQLTGTPRVFRAYAHFDGRGHWCGHNHRSTRTAKACAVRLAREMDAVLGWEKRRGQDMTPSERAD